MPGIILGSPRIKPRAWYMLGKCPITELQPQSLSFKSQTVLNGRHYYHPMSQMVKLKCRQRKSFAQVSTTSMWQSHTITIQTKMSILAQLLSASPWHLVVGPSPVTPHPIWVLGSQTPIMASLWPCRRLAAFQSLAPHAHCLNFKSTSHLGHQKASKVFHLRKLVNILIEH